MIVEKRLARRFLGRFGIVSSDNEGLNFSFVTNLSREGAYVEAEKLLSVGTQFDFVLSNGVTSATITSRVVRLRDAFFHGGKSGFGVRFDDLTGLAKVIRDDLLLYCMNFRYQRRWFEKAA